MLSFSQTPLARYSCAVVIVCIALLATIQIETVATQTPFAFFFGAVAASSWILGRGPGFLVEILSAAGAQFLLIPQLNDLQPDVSRSFQFGSFLLMGSVIVLATSSVRQYLSKAKNKENHFGSLFDQNPFPVWIVDAKTERFLAVNHAAIDVYGYSEEEFLRLNMSDITLDDDVLGPTEIENDCGRRRGPIAVSKHRRKDGSSFYVELTSRDLVDGKGSARLIHSIDVTERIRTSHALKINEARLLDVFGSCPVSMTVNRWSDHTFIDVNKEFSELTGWGLDDIRGKTAVDSGLLPADVEKELDRKSVV